MDKTIELEARLYTLEQSFLHTKELLNRILSKSTYSVKEFSELSNLSENTIRKYIKDGKIMLESRTKKERTQKRVNYRIPASELMNYKKITI